MRSEPTMTSLNVDLGDRSYAVEIGNGLIETAGARLKAVVPSPQVFVITDENVAASWLAPLQKSLDHHGIKHATKIFPPGEQTKSIRCIDELTAWLLDQGIDRKTTLVALGGGVIGDLTGFAAAITLRGVPFIQIPTTLLAQVDSSVGGKTGIDTPQGKNLIGAFHQPLLVLADTDTLNTLPRRQVLAGYAEVVKYGMISDPAFFDWCEMNAQALVDGDAEARRYAIEQSCRAKAEIVADDEREAGRRALLNLGHTFAHAFEAEAGYSDKLLHGEAVAFGCLCAFELSHRLELCTGQDVVRVARHLEGIGLPTSVKNIAEPHWTPELIIRHMSKDKKTESGQLTFVLARAIGEAFTTRDVPADLLNALVADMMAR